LHNFSGPLLYHYADMPLEQSIELSQDELINVVKKNDFVVETQSWHNTFYAGNTMSMMNVAYKAAYFCAKKPYRSDQQLGNQTNSSQQ